MITPGPQGAAAAVDPRDEHLRLEFVAFLYAAAIHLLIHHASSSVMTLDKAFLVSFIVLYFMADWLARFRLPAKAEDVKEAAWVASSEIWKLMLEVFGLTFLTLAALGVVHRISGAGTTTHSYPIESLFAFFVLSTFLWNLLVFRNMNEADWLSLLKACFMGSASSSQAERTYLRRFKEYREELAKPGSSASGLNIVAPLRDAFRVAIGEVTAQFLAFHLALSHISVFLLLIGAAARHSSEPLLSRLSERVVAATTTSWLVPAASAFFLLAALVALTKFISIRWSLCSLAVGITLVVAMWHFCPWWSIGKDLMRAFLAGAALVFFPAVVFFSLAFQGDGLGQFRRVGASWLTLAMIASFAAMPSENLIGFFALEQFVVGLALQLLVTTRVPSKKEASS